ncbi:hypothetical protein K501DRAFT_235425 [Backusella circina FSU 941]|nr:hypothetical protein K501DRAFT_235425 [Backusella circina FSU 941]
MTDLDERPSGNYRKLLDTIERGESHCSTAQLKDLLNARKSKFPLGLEAFGPKNSASRTKVNSGGVSGKLEQKEKEFIYGLSDLLEVDELECASIFESYKEEKNIEDDITSNNTELTMSMITVYYEERLSLLECISSLIRISVDDEHPYAEIANTAITSIATSHSFMQKIFDQFKELVRSSVPLSVDNTPGWASVWVKQNLREQKALMELLSLLASEIPVQPEFSFTVIQEMEANHFGLPQSFSYVVDEESEQLRSQITSLCILLSVAIIVPIKENNALFESPETISKINQVALYLGYHSAHSPFLLAWTYFLSNLEENLDTLTSPCYNVVRSLLNGQQAISNDILAPRPFSRESDEERVPYIQQVPNVYTRFMGRALALDVFDVVSTVAKNGVCSEENAVLHHMTLRILLKSFFATTRPYFIPDDSYNNLVRAYCDVYKNQPVLCALFWMQDFENENQCSLLNLARSRFPVSFENFVSIATALSTSSVAKNSAESVFNYLKSIPTMAVMTKRSSILEQIDINGTSTIQITQPLIVVPASDLFPAIEIPAGTQGIIASDINEEERIVKFSVSYSGWSMLMCILARSIYFGNTVPSMFTVVDADNQLSGENPETIASILELIHCLLVNSPNTPQMLIAETEVNGPMGEQPSRLITLLVNILNQYHHKSLAHVRILTLATECLTILLPYYRQSIWNYLHSAPIIPQATASSTQRYSRNLHQKSDIRSIVVNVECTSGRYPTLIAFLDLVNTLVHDIQNLTISEGPQATETLYLCLRYLMLDVFPSYSGWRYKQYSERLLIGTKLLDIFSEICTYFDIDGLKEIREGVFQHFLHDGGVYYTSHLLDTLSEGANIANKMYKTNHVTEAKLVEQLTEKTFVFIQILLQYQLDSLKQGNSRRSILERLLLERTTGTNNPDFLLRIAKHIHYPHRIQIPIQATQVISLLCQIVASWENVPNFVQYLGATAQARQVINKYLEVAKDHSQNELLLASIWKLFTLSLKVQPTLATLFLETSSSVELNSALLSLNPPDNGKPVSALHAAIDMLTHWKDLATKKPTVLSNITRFISVFWETAFDHFEAIEAGRNSTSLWTSLQQILQHKIDGSLDITSGSDQDETVRRICCVNLSQAHIMRSMTLELHLMASGSEKKKLTTGVQTLLTSLSQSPKLDELRQKSTKNSYDNALKPRMEAEMLVLSRSTNDSFGSKDGLICKVPFNGWGDCGKLGESREYGSSYIYDLSLIKKRVYSRIGDNADKTNPNIKKFLSSVCQVNYNDSIADSEVSVLRSFKTFIETASCHTGDIIFKTDDSLFNFIKHMAEKAAHETRDDGVTLTQYSLMIAFIRGLVEDWIIRGCSKVVNNDVSVRKMYADQVFDILSASCNLLQRENFTALNSIHDRTAIRFHRPLLETIMLCIDTLFSIVSSLTSTRSSEDRFKSCITTLLNVICESFRVLVIKAGSYSASGSSIPEEVAESCIKDVTVVVSLLQKLVHPTYKISEDVWLSILETHKTIPSLLDLFYGGVQLTVQEVDRQINNTQTMDITPYAETALYFLLLLSNIPEAAKQLVNGGLFVSFCNNSLTSRLQQGGLDLFLRFNNGSSDNKTLLVERNPLHSIWCQMLGVISNVMRTLGGDESILSNTVNFMQVYSAQIGRAFEHANGSNDSIYGFSSAESLSSPSLEEMERISLIFFGLSQNLSHFTQIPTDLFGSYKDCSLVLLHRYNYHLTHPTQMESQLYPIDNTERELAQVFVGHDGDESQINNKKPQSKLALKILKIILTIAHYTLTSLVIQTNADVILTTPDIEWPFGNTIIYPDMRNNQENGCSFGTLIEYINQGSNMVNTWMMNENEYPIQSLLDVVQDCSILLASQTVLWIAKPDITEEVRMEIASYNVKDIIGSLSKVTSMLKKMDEKTKSVDTKIRVQLVNSLQNFLTLRFFEV